MIAGECLPGARDAGRRAVTAMRKECGAWDSPPLGADALGTDIAPNSTDMVMNDLAGVLVMALSVEYSPRADAVAREALLQLTGRMDLREVSGIAIVTDDRGRVVDATEAAGPLAAALGGGAPGGLAELIDRAFAAGPVCEPVTLADATAYTLAVLPLGQGGALIIGRDATLEQNLRDALVDSRQRYKDFVECSSDFAWETDADGRFVFVSPRGALGCSARELTGRAALELLHERHREPLPLPFQSLAPREGVAVWMRAANGSAVLLDTACVPLFDRSGRWTGARGVCRDVTTAWVRDRQLAKARHRERLVTGLVISIRDEADPEKLLARTAKAAAEALDAAFCTIHRLDPDRKLVCAVANGEAIDTTLRERLDEDVNWLHDDSRAVELSLDGYTVLAAASRHRDAINGAICVARTAGDEPWSEDDRALVDGVVGQLGIAIEQIAAHETLKRLSRTDELTGLCNRRAFMETLGRRCKHALRTGRPAALLYADLDNFKMVNDVHGHQRGDEVLVALAELLDRHTRANDVVARFGGDEFALWLDGIDHAAAIAKAVALLEASVPLEAHSGDGDHPLRLSIGIAAFDPTSGEDLESLIARADAAMYEAKKTGKGVYAVAAPAKHVNVQEDKP